MNRRTFLSLASAGVLSASLAAEAQPTRTLYRISFLGLTPGEDTASLTPLLERLRELNYHEGQAGRRDCGIRHTHGTYECSSPRGENR